MLENDKEMKNDRKRLVDFCCAPNSPVMIQVGGRQ
jgi:hypothetical protein